MKVIERSSLRVFRNAFWDIYDNLRQVVQVNVIWLVLTCLVVTAPMAAAGLFFWSERLVVQGEARLRDFFEGMRRCSLRFVIELCAVAGFAGIWALAIFFYLRVLPAPRPWGSFLAGIALWIGVTFALVQAVTLPLLARPALRLDIAIWQGWGVTLSGPFLCASACMGLLLVEVLLLVSGAGALLLSGAFAAVLCSHLLREVGGLKEPSVQEREARRHTWRGFIRPWE